MNDIVPAEKGQKAKQEIAKLETGHRVAPIVPRNVDEAFRISQAVLAAGLAPDSYDNDPQKILVGILKGAEVGLPPITALSTIAIINKRPCIWGDGAVALVQGSGKLEYMKEYLDGDEGTDDWTAFCEMKRKDQDGIYYGQFSVKDAKRAKLWGNPKRAPWMQYPQRMLQMRARSWCIRNAFADFLSGLSIAEEVQDLPAAPDHVDTRFLDDTPLVDGEKGAIPLEELPAQTPEKLDELAEEQIAAIQQEYDKQTQSAPAEPQDAATEPDKLSRRIEASLRACVSVENLDAFWASMEASHTDYLRRVYENLRATMVERGEGKPEDPDPALFP